MQFDFATCNTFWMLLLPRLLFCSLVEVSPWSRRVIVSVSVSIYYTCCFEHSEKAQDVRLKFRLHRQRRVIPMMDNVCVVRKPKRDTVSSSSHLPRFVRN